MALLFSNPFHAMIPMPWLGVSYKHIDTPRIGADHSSLIDPPYSLCKWLVNTWSLSRAACMEWMATVAVGLPHLKGRPDCFDRLHDRVVEGGIHEAQARLLYTLGH